jgi:uncharacterized protein GlcG (DUF336 family)
LRSKNKIVFVFQLYIIKILLQKLAGNKSHTNQSSLKSNQSNMEITLQQAERAIELARRKADEIRVAVNIVVLDTGGYIKSFTRMDDAFLGSIDIAIHKAKTAMLFRTNSEVVGEFLKPEAAAYGLENTNGGLVAFPGGRPIVQNGKIIGYIGISGGAVPQDLLIATAGSII